MRYSLRLFSAFLLTLGVLIGAAAAEEGMWTFDNPPRERLSKEYGFTPSQAWLDNLRLASVRFMDGGSGSFVSPKGLAATNHHVAVGQLHKLSSEKKDYVRDGFFAPRTEDEIPLSDLELNVLVSMEDVTGVVTAAAAAKADGEEAALKARKAEQARIEKESIEATGLRSEVVSLYRGGEYWLYRYRKYTDVRLVFAPERQAAYFGGDDDNFTFPRHDLDITFVRVYENGSPLRTEHYLRWNPRGAADGELVFVSGHPGSTRRLNTMVQLEYLRAVEYAQSLEGIDRAIAALNTYAGRGSEELRRALVPLFGYGNARKCRTGELEGLRSSALMARRRADEDELRARVAAEAELKGRYGSAWDRIERLYREHGEERAKLTYQGLGRSRLGRWALDIVNYVEEVGKPDAERLNGFHDSELEELRFRLFSPAPVYPDLEAVFLEVSFRLSLEKLGADHPFSHLLVELGDPAAAAKRLCGETRLIDPAYRKELIEKGSAAVEESTDPLIALARRIVPFYRAGETWRDTYWDSVETAAGEEIARARFAAYGKSVYPDATFTLRLAYGRVAGYPMNGTRAPYKTTLYGLYDRAESFERQGDFDLPERFFTRRAELNLSTPVNFVCTCDITGGNSGSPVVNRAGELVGLIFDGNIESLSNEFCYDQERGRAVAVHSAYVLEALRKLYDAERLADELLGRWF